MLFRSARKDGGLVVERVGKPPVNVHRRTLDEKRVLELSPALAKVPGFARKLVVPKEASVVVLDERTMYTSLAGRLAVERAARARPAKSEPRVPDELAKLLRQQDADDIAVVTVLNDSLHPALQLIADESTRETFDQFEYVVGRVRGGKEVSITVEVEGKSSDLGATLETKCKRVLTVLRDVVPKAVDSEPHRRVLDGLLKSFRVSRKDARVTLSATLSRDDARLLLAPVKRKE